MQKIFISYSRDDGEFALKLTCDLRAQGIPVWLDQLDIAAGSRWDHEIEQALRTCATLVVLMSPNSVSSHNVMDEVSYALEQGKRVIPVMIRECEVPFRLRRLQRASFMSDYETGLVGLLPILGAVGRHLPTESARTGSGVSAPLAPSETMSQNTSPAHSEVAVPPPVSRRLMTLAAGVGVAVIAAGLIGLNVTTKGQPFQSSPSASASASASAPAPAPAPASASASASALPSSTAPVPALAHAAAATAAVTVEHCGAEGQPNCTFSPARRIGPAGCEGAGFFDPLVGGCWICPAGWQRTMQPVSGAQACSAPIGATCQSGLVANDGVCARRQVCGGDGERPCRVSERVPSCNAGLTENARTDRCVGR